MTLFSRIFCEDNFPQRAHKRLSPKLISGQRPDAPLTLYRGMLGRELSQGDYRDYQTAREGGQLRREQFGGHPATREPGETMRKLFGVTRRASTLDAIKRLSQMRRQGGQSGPK